MSHAATAQKKITYSNFDEKGDYKEGFAEHNSGQVMTIEDEAFTIQDLFNKFTTGVLNPATLVRPGEEVEYTDDMMQSEVPEFIDRTDVSEYVDRINDRKKRAENALNEAARKKSAEDQAEKDKRGTSEDDKADPDAK